MATKGESARTKFADMYKDDKTDEEGDPKAGIDNDGDEDDEDGDYSVSECIADVESALKRLKSKVGKK